MDRLDRIFALHHLLNGKRVHISIRDIEAGLECSNATAKRVMDDLKVKLGAPLEYSHEYNGYRYESDKNIYELPGLWLNQSELMALIASEQLLAEVEPGVLTPMIEPLRERLLQLLKQRHLGAKNLLNRIRIFQAETRATNTDTFRQIAEALGARRQIKALYHGRDRDQTTERTLSPQRLVYYRDNWYLDAWCHERKDLRTFSIDRLHIIEKLKAPAKDIPEADLDAHFKSGYGLFAGKATHTAVLRFTAEQANWVADEQWHPDQKGETLPDGSYQLQVPYANDRELIMQIMKYGADVEVLAPASLRKEVASRLQCAAEQYEQNSK